MSKTKIIASIGPASQDKAILKEMIACGMDVARLNLSHASHDFCRDIIRKINELNEEMHTYVSIMLDTNGTNIRVGSFIGGSAYLRKGTKIRIYRDKILGDETKFSTDCPELYDSVRINCIIKLNDGLIDLQVIDKGLDYILCLVLNDGLIENNKKLTIPGLCLKKPFLSEKDKADIAFAHEVNADFLALSYVRNAEDVLEVNDMLINLGNDHMQIISKIENANALEDLDEIIRLSDGIMVARGDLGVELPIEKIPIIQKAIINRCHQAGKVSIVATEMMASMETEVRPTRAEVSDVANAVLDGTDAVMLSGETTNGKFPIQTLSIMTRIIDNTEENTNYLDYLNKALQTEKQDITGSIAYSVVECANRLKCVAIIAPTVSGYTARKMSRFRPSCPIIAVSPNINTVKSLTLHFGVQPALIDELNSLDRIISKSKAVASTIVNVKPHDKIIITGGYPFKESKHTNFMKIEEVEE